MDDERIEFTLKECNEVLHNLGNEIVEPMTILAIGGYCMLNLGIREATTDVDYVPSDPAFIMPSKYQRFVNSDVLNITDLNIDFDELLSFTNRRIEFGKLSILLADTDLLLALKFVAIQRRSVERDRIDLLALARKANKIRTFKALQIISTDYFDYDTFESDLETELYIAQATKKVVTTMKLF